MIGTIRNLFSGGGSPSRSSAVIVVDGERLLDGGDRSGPVERVQLLQKLGKFAGREGLTVKAILGGRPLREVDHEGEYAGIQVFYADSGKVGDDDVYAAARRFGRQAIVVTSSTGLESRLLGQGITTLRSSTFKRGLDLGNGDGGRTGSPGGGGGGGRVRTRRRRGRRGGPPGDGGSGGGSRGEGGKRGGNGPGKASEDGGGGNESSVKNLIDLVD